MTRVSSIAVASSLLLVLLPATGAMAQSSRPLTSAMTSTAPKPVWDGSIAGKWTYRSYRNDSSVLVNTDADAAVQALTPIYGDGVSTAASALKALNLVFGEGIITFDPPAGNALTGDLDMGGGYVLDFKGTMQTSASGTIDISVIGTGRDGTKTANWEYDYKASTTPKWPNGVDQVAALVGTVIRAKPHDASPAGVVASFIALKH
jgi:hypothetical protein